MAIEDLLPVLEIVPDLLRNLPTIIFVLQVVAYFFMIMFFGSIAIRGYRGYANFFIRIGVRFGLGAVALIGGIALSNVFPIMDGFLKAFQLDMIVFGLIASIILFFIVYMITFNIINIEGARRKIEQLQKMISKAQSVKGSKKLAPISIAGIVILAGFIGFSLFFFGGFPNILQDFGLDPDNLNDIANEIDALRGGGANLPAGCTSLVAMAGQVGVQELLSNPVDDPQARTMIEAYTGSTVLQTYSLIYQQQEVLIGLTVDNQVCSIMNNNVCECIVVSS